MNKSNDKLMELTNKGNQIKKLNLKNNEFSFFLGSENFNPPPQRQHQFGESHEHTKARRTKAGFEKFAQNRKRF